MAAHYLLGLPVGTKCSPDTRIAEGQQCRRRVREKKSSSHTTYEQNEPLFLMPNEASELPSIHLMVFPSLLCSWPTTSGVGVVILSHIANLLLPTTNGEVWRRAQVYKRSSTRRKTPLSFPSHNTAYRSRSTHLGAGASGTCIVD